LYASLNRARCHDIDNREASSQAVPFCHLDDPRSSLDLLALGGQQLFDFAGDEAGEYVDRECRWDGVGDVPAQAPPAQPFLL
jgi:hypothetical protein